MKYKPSGLGILALMFLCSAVGISLLTGHNAHSGPWFGAFGGALLIGGTATLAITVRRWAGYFCAVCILCTIKTMLALLFGVPHVSWNAGACASISARIPRFVCALDDFQLPVHRSAASIAVWHDHASRWCPWVSVRCKFGAQSLAV